MPTNPSLTFDAAYFTGGRPYGYSDYRRSLLPFDHYADYLHAQMDAHSQIDPNRDDLLVVGCAYGYTVEWLRDTYGMDAYGQDISQYAIDQSPVPGAVTQGDARSGIDTQFTNGQRYDIVFTECVLSCLSDADAQTLVDNCRDAAKYVVHRVWTADGSDVNLDGDYYNAKTLAEWQSLVDPNGNDEWYHETEFVPTAPAKGTRA